MYVGLNVRQCSLNVCYDRGVTKPRGRGFLEDTWKLIRTHLLKCYECFLPKNVILVI